MDWVADQLRDRGVIELERLATALWVTREIGEDASVDIRARRLHAIKPHVKIGDADEAVQEINHMLATAASVTVE